MASNMKCLSRIIGKAEPDRRDMDRVRCLRDDRLQAGLTNRLLIECRGAFN